jgi:hypothetical protein
MIENNESLPLIQDPNEIVVSSIQNEVPSTETASKSEPEPEVPAKEQKPKAARQQLVGPMQFVIKLINLKLVLFLFYLIKLYF